MNIFVSFFFNLKGKSFNIYYCYDINSRTFIDILYHIKEVLCSSSLQRRLQYGD